MRFLIGGRLCKEAGISVQAKCGFECYGSDKPLRPGLEQEALIES